MPGRAPIPAARRRRGCSMPTAPLPLTRTVKLYRGATALATPLAPLILRRREQRGKEDGARRNERFGVASVTRPAGKLVWFHAASVGETIAALPLIEAVQRARPGHQMLLTTGTVTSAEIAAQRLPLGAIHQYVPVDAPQFVRRFLDHWRPELGIFMESEIWPNLVIESAARQIPLAIVNARMSKETFRSWRKRPGLADPLFSRITAVLAQNQTFALRYGQLGVGNVVHVGNLKNDAPPPPADAALVADLKARLAGRPVWLAASTHADEELIAAGVHQRLKAALPGLVTVIVPRHPERGAGLAGQLADLGLSVGRRARGAVIEPATDIYLADTLGELGSFFAAIPLAFIGKSLSQDGGGHNPIEAIQHGAAVITGSSWFNFEDAYKALIAGGAVVEVNAADALGREVQRLLSDPEAAALLRSKATKTLSQITGALERTLAAVLVLLPDDGVGATRVTVTKTRRKAQHEGLLRVPS